MKRFLSFLLSALMVLSLVATAGIMVVAADHEPAVDTTVDAATVSVYDGTPDYSWFVSADGTGTLTYVDATEYTLTKADEFMGFANLVNGAATVTYVDSSTSTETTAAVPAQKFTGKTIKLGKNLVINQGDADTWTKDTTGLYNWVPIGHDKGSGSAVNLTFQGTFDGQDHYISGVYSVAKWSANADYKAVGAKAAPADGRDNGFFFHASNGAVIKNFSIINSAFINTGNTYQGNSSVCTRITGGVTVENIYSDAYVNGKWGTGAIVGYSNNAIKNAYNYVKNCVFTGTLVKEDTATSRNAGFGLMVGCIEGKLVYIEDCLFAGKLTSNYSQELIGAANNAEASLKNCRAIINGKVVYNDIYLDSWTKVSGQNYSVPSDPLELYNDYLSNVNNYDLYEESQATDENLYGWFTVDANGKATAKTYTLNSAEAFIGFRNLVNGEGKGWYDANENGSIDDGEIIAVAAQPFADITRKDPGSNPGKDNNAATTAWYVTSVANQITIKLGVNIVLNEGDASEWTKDTTGLYEWIPIGHNNQQMLPFSGIFDGNGKYISGVFSPANWNASDVGCPARSQKVQYTDHTGESKTSDAKNGWTVGRDNGLFGGTSNATIKNFAIVNSAFINWETGSYQGNGSIVSRANSGTKIDNVYSNAFVNGQWGVGGLVGFVGGYHAKLKACSITNCVFAGTLTKSKNEGSLNAAFGLLVGCNEKTAMTMANCAFIGTLQGSTVEEYFVSIQNSVGSCLYSCYYPCESWENYTNWVELEGDIEVPAKAWNVAKKSFDDVKLSFVQETDVVEGEYTIRLASEIFNLDATKAGYEIKVGDIWRELGSSTTVYKSLNAKGGDGQIAKIQADYGKYYTALELIAEAGSEVSFTVRPYIVIEGETSYGTAYTITYDAEGAFVSAVAAN